MEGICSLARVVLIIAAIGCLQRLIGTHLLDKALKQQHQESPTPENERCIIENKAKGRKKCLYESEPHRLRPRNSTLQ